MITSFSVQSRLAPDQHIILVSPQTEKCFINHLLIGQKIVVNFQVIMSEETSITVKIFNPLGGVLVRKSGEGGRLKVDSQMSGNHQVCFDNTISEQDYKFVVFEVKIDKKIETEENSRELGDENIDHQSDYRNSCPKHLMSLERTVTGHQSFVHERTQIRVLDCENWCHDIMNKEKVEQYNLFLVTLINRKCDDEDPKILYQKYFNTFKNTQMWYDGVITIMAEAAN